MIDMSILDRHDKIALCFSGGKDSLACLWLLRDYLSRVTVYHRDTGDLLPEIRDVVSRVEPMCPNFVRLDGNVRDWIKDYGLPTDLLPYSTHGVGVSMGQSGAKLVTRYQCCFTNLMYPMWDRIKDDGNTLCIRGTKRADMRRLPAETGAMQDGIELWFPINDWSHADVFAYLRANDAPLASIYDHMTNAPECARCPAWWGEGRSAYMRDRHPELYREYREGLRIVAAEVAGPIADLTRELGEG